MFEKSNVKSGDNVSFKESSESCTHSHEVVVVEIVAAFSTWGGGVSWCEKNHFIPIIFSYYSSLDLADRLLEEFSMTCVGTLQANRKGLPESFKSTKDRPEGDYQVLYEVDGKKSIHSWITNTKSGKKGQKPDSDYGGGGGWE
jgi:hypothetical protein